MIKTQCFILCGGGGERLWPLSRKKRPKQFIPFLNKGSLLEQTIHRIFPLVQDKNDMVVVTTQEQEKQVLDLGIDSIGSIIKEPSGRNTGPAVLYSCLSVVSKDPDAVAIFLPADSFVLQEEKYRRSLDIAVSHAYESNTIVTLGVFPTYPATGYGYIQADCKQTDSVDGSTAYNVKKFHEKPDLENAQDYIKKGNMFWNIGVFVGKISVFLEEFKAHCPDLFGTMQRFVNNQASYDEAENISIDFAVMEKSDRISILPCDFEWSDVGNLDVFLSLQKQLLGDKDSVRVINMDAQDNLAHISNSGRSKKMVVFLGVKDICLIEDNDVILVAQRADVEKVKSVLKHLKKESLDRFL